MILLHRQQLLTETDVLVNLTLDPIPFVALKQALHVGAALAEKVHCSWEILQTSAC